MIERVKRKWQEFKASVPGHRFQERYERRQRESHGKHDARKIINLLAGLVVAVVGLVLIPLPGPGFLIVGLGMGLIGCEFQSVARFLDRAELWWRKLHKHAKQEWQQVPTAVKALVLLIALIITLAVGYGGYQLFIRQRS